VILFIILSLLYFQAQKSLMGNWKQSELTRDGIRETLQITKDSLFFHREFYSKDHYTIINNNLSIINIRKENIVQSKINIRNDTLYLTDETNRLTDRMVKISRGSNNKIAGTWKGKTNRGINTYFTFNGDGSVIYRAVLDEKHYRYKASGFKLLIYASGKLQRLGYQINKNLLTLVFKDTGEAFHYIKTDTLIY